MAEGTEQTFFYFYFCHNCKTEVSVLNAKELICPQCSGDFLEEISEDKSIFLSNDEYEDEESDVDDSEQNLLDLLTINDILNRTAVRAAGEEPDSPPRLYSDESNDDDDLYAEVSSFLTVGPRNASGEIIERSLHELLNPTGVEAFSNWLFDGQECNGDPPLPKEDIKLLPKVTISQEHIENGLQCTVCMEDFSLKESAKCLPCQHLYHENCITAWLEKHATCPNCRKTIESQSTNHRSQSRPRNNQSSGSSSSSSITSFFTSSLLPFQYM